MMNNGDEYKQNMLEQSENGEDGHSASSAVCQARETFTEYSAMLKRVANSEAHFKHQQRGEPDLTTEEKMEIAFNLLQTKPAVFLSRFGKFLCDKDLVHFSSMKDDYEISFHLKEIWQRLNDSQNAKTIRNRRLKAMQELQGKGDYFTDEEMKNRDPLLYEQMVGKYLTEDEIAAEIDKSDLKFSNILLSHIQMQQNNLMYRVQKDLEEGQMEEDEEDDEEEDECGEDGRTKLEDESGDADGTPGISESEKLLLRKEFVRTMELRFLNGEDDFNYGEVDGNTDYDQLDILGRDAEEKYFDDEDAETVNSASSMDSLKQQNKLEDVEDYEMYEPDSSLTMDIKAASSNGGSSTTVEKPD